MIVDHCRHGNLEGHCWECLRDSRGEGFLPLEVIERRIKELRKMISENQAAMGVQKTFIREGEKQSNVSHPVHYNAGKIEVIEFIEDQGLNFSRGNVVKYTARAGKKAQSPELEDLEKARWYLEREIELQRAKQEGRDVVRPNDMNPRK